MFGNIISCLSQLWELLCESMSSTTTSQTPSSSATDSMPSATNSQTQLTLASSSTPTQYDVFLSFRGEDTRLTFTGHLYDKLDTKGISTFKDDSELHSGEVISDALRDAIRNSKTYIVVFSQNYATSPWCLNELTEILNCHRTIQRWVIPVFFNIDPSVVRHQTGSFQKAIKKLQKRFRDEREKLENWRLTLKEVADFSGHHISKDRSEADVINEIVDELLLKINPKTLDVAKFPVGLDSRVEAITTLLSSDTEGVIKFGIYGMGGVGKTTLAKALFNQLVGGGSFKGSCFLANVREASCTFKGLESLQQQLINEVLRCTTKVEVHNVDQGIKLIEARICSTKVVVVVDDLDDLNHLQLLVGPFASGSVVIITTRDKEILDKTEVETSYQYLVNTLDDADSLALFMRHAFGNAEPSDTLMELSKDILRLAAGLPLALEIFGSHLFNKSEVGWKYYIEKLQRSPNSNIQQRLEISLDALESDDPVLKKVFLDIACFFIGWQKQEVVHIMDCYYFYADHFIDMLKKRCLLTISNGRLGMHDLLQDVGKEIVRNSSPDEPGKRSRLWASNDICDVLKNKNGTKAIECIICRYGEYALDGVTLTADTFKRMRKLRFLKLEKVNLTRSLEQKFEDLRWLNWKHCPLECLPSEFYPQKLAILELTYSNMRTTWELNMVPHVFGNLKTVKMSHSKYLITTPEFTKLPCLETLDLGFCESLEEVHMSIGSLARLVSLNLYRCVKLRILPDTICNLRALKVLTISFCSSLKALPIQLGNIESLTELNTIALTVSKLPDSIGSLTKLVKLDLSRNWKLETLPDTIGNLRSLETLSIESCTKLQALPDELWKITRLRELNASGAYMLKKLPDIGSGQIALSLQELKLSYSGIIALPSGFSQLSNLPSLDLTFCFQLLSIPKLPPNLKRINASYCESLERLPNLSNLKQLEELELAFCSGLTNIYQGLEDLISIRRLVLRGLTHRHLRKRLFKVYSEFGHQIDVHVSEFIDQSPSRIKTHPRGLDWIIQSPYWTSKSSDSKSTTVYWPNTNESHNFMDQKTDPQWLDWITESPYWTSKSSEYPESTTVYAHLLPNESHNFMGIILCFQRPKYVSNKYSVKNTTSGFIWSSGCPESIFYGSVMVIVPKSIFSVTDDDHRIELTTHDNVEIVGIHLLYNTETETIEDVVEKHVIHIDSLKVIDPVLKDIFLDIACFFIGSQKKRVVQILETYYTNVDHNIDILKTRCLLKINDQDELEMDDLGRKLARKNSLEESKKLSRLWLLRDIYYALKKHKGTEVIEGIVHHEGYLWDRDDALTGESFTLETFEKMSKLRFLCLRKVHLTGSFEQTFQDLRWLCWKRCPLKCLPFEFYPPKLVILELPHSSIITMWELNMVPHVFQKLKTLNMSDSQGLTTTPDFTKLPCLETLNLRGCKSLEEVHVSIGSLVRLVSIDLHGCIKLRSLPNTICNLRTLEELDITGCSCLEALPMALGNIQSLRELNAGNLTVSVLPDSIGHLSELVKLRLSSNKNLITLPVTICNLRSLEILDISGCEKLEILLDQLCKVTSLRELIASHATFLKEFPYVESSQMALSLQKLDFSGSGLTALLSSISNLSNLEDLNLNYCCCLLSIAELPRNLKWIRANGCKLMERLPNLSNLKQLEHLDLKYCSGLTEIEGLTGLRSIRRLHLKGCNSSLLAYIFTESFFQMYSEFGHPIQICSTEFSDWISQSRECEKTMSSDGYFSTMSLNLAPNVSHNYLGMILCIRSSGHFYRISYSVQNTTSHFIWRGEIAGCDVETLMVILPRSTFSVKDGDDRIILEANGFAKIYGIHLLNKIGRVRQHH